MFEKQVEDQAAPKRVRPESFGKPDPKKLRELANLLYEGGYFPDRKLNPVRVYEDLHPGEKTRLMRCLTVLDHPKAIENIFAATRLYTRDEERAFKDVTRVLLRLGEVVVKGSPTFYADRHMKLIEYASNFSRRMDSTFQQPGTPKHYTLEFELMSHLAMLVRDRPHSPEAFELFCAMLYVGLSDRRTPEQGKLHLQHASSLLESLLRGPLDGCIVEARTGREPQLSHHEPLYGELLRQLALVDLTYERGVLHILTKSNLDALHVIDKSLPNYAELAKAQQLCQQFGTRHFNGEKLFSSALQAVSSIPELCSTQEMAFTDKVLVGIVLAQAAIDAPLREALDDIESSRDQEQRAERFRETCNSALQDFFAELKQTHSNARVSLAIEIANLFEDADLKEQYRERLVLSLRVYAPFQQLYRKPSDIIKAVKKLAVDNQVSDAQIRELPVLLRRFQPSSRGRYAGEVMYPVANATELNDFVSKGLSLSKQFPGREMQTMRTMTELLELNYFVDLKVPRASGSRSSKQAVSNVTMFVKQLGPEPLPILYLSYLSAVRDLRLDEVLTKFANAQFGAAKSPQEIISLILPLIKRPERQSATKFAIGPKDHQVRSLSVSARSVAERLEPGKLAGIDDLAAWEADGEWQSLKSTASVMKFSKLYGVDCRQLQEQWKTGDHPSIRNRSKSLAVRSFFNWVKAERAAVSAGEVVASWLKCNPYLSFDPLHADIAVQALGVLQREFSFAERRSWPAVGRTDVCAALQKVSVFALRDCRVPRNENYSPSNLLSCTTKAGKAEILELPNIVVDRDLPIARGLKLDSAKLHSYQLEIQDVRNTIAFARAQGETVLCQMFRDRFAAKSEYNDFNFKQVNSARSAVSLVLLGVARRIARVDAEFSKANGEVLSRPGENHFPETMSEEDERLVVDSVPYELCRALAPIMATRVSTQLLPEYFDELMNPRGSLDFQASAALEFVGRIVRPAGESGKSHFSNDAIVRRLAGQLFKAPIMEEILNSMLVVSDTSVFQDARTHGVRLCLSRGMILENLGAASDTCATKVERASEKHTNMAFLALVTQDKASTNSSAKVDYPSLQGGVGLMVVSDSAGNRCLLLRGINPRAQLLKQVSPVALLEAVLDHAADIARHLECRYLVVADEPAVGRTVTNRIEILYLLQRNYAYAPQLMLGPDSLLSTYNNVPIKTPCKVLRSLD